MRTFTKDFEEVDLYAKQYKISNKRVAMTQKDKRQGIDIGSAIGQVSPVTYWYKSGYFQNEDEARGAFRLAYQQGLDGMGESIAKWMGLTSEEYDVWMRTEALPKL